MERELISRILFLNPWLADEGQFPKKASEKIPSKYIQRLLPSDLLFHHEGPTGKAKLIVGPRQSGKSTLVWSILSKKEPPPVFLLCEDRLIQDWCRDPVPFLRDLKELFKAPASLFLEEVQHLEEAGLFIKGLVDLNYAGEIWVTGSSSFHLLAKTRESLAGRATRLILYPFSYLEVSRESHGLPPAVAQFQNLERLERLVIYGGYPDVYLGDRPEHVLSDLIEAFVMRDASDLFKVTKPDAFRQLLKLTAYDIGNLVNLSNWAGMCAVDRKTVESYLEAMESSHILRRVYPFRGGKRSEVGTVPKIYFLDNGMRNQLLGLLPMGSIFLRPDLGPLVENWVFTELCKYLPRDWELRYWRSTSKAEVDFVLVHGDRIIGVEVKAGRLNKKMLSKSSRSFIAAYRPREFAVVNLTLEAEEKVDETAVKFLPLHDLPHWIKAQTGMKWQAV